MFDLQNIGDKISDLAGENVGDVLKNTVSGMAGEASEKTDDFNKLVQELIAKVTGKIGNVAEADDRQISDTIQSIIAGVDLKNFDQSKIVAAIKQGIEILKKSFGK